MSGGLANAATDFAGSILGGCSNLTGTGTNPRPQSSCFSGAQNVVNGGFNNSAQGTEDSILGGQNVTPSGDSFKTSP